MIQRRGLSLLELVVALTVIAVTVAAGRAALGAVADARERARRHDDDPTVRAASVRRQLVSWLEGAHLGDDEVPAFQVTDHRRNGRPDDELTFLTSALTPLGRGDVVVRLYVDREPRTPELGLVAELAERRGTRVERLVLAPTVTGLDVRCFTESRGRREWLASWLSATVLPQGVELRLFAATTEQLAPLLRVPVTVAIEGGR